ncbi:MAG: sugar kinase [Chloroflexi bacterium RBG_13_56_8]|nr:MAG: sugar kinase [Chloroflexi bacterium RBG_13_56_8]
MSILVVGSVALDDVQTPAGRCTRTLGGACSYFATAASLYDRVNMIGVVGTDFPHEHVEFFSSRNIDLRGLQVMEGDTFFWAGRYGEDLDAETLDTQLNVFADFHPIIPEDLRDSEYVFLANIDPELQIEVLDQIRSPKLVALDSMNYWIQSKREALMRAISKIDVLLLNQGEMWLLVPGEPLVRAAQMLLEQGPHALIVKRGEHGAILMTRGQSLGESVFLAPAYPLDRVVDPTGAGDSFAAGFMGYLARHGCLSIEALRRAVVHGAVVASFTVQDFSVDRLRTLSMQEIEARYDDFRRFAHFEPLTPVECRAYQTPCDWS